MNPEAGALRGAVQRVPHAKTSACAAGSSLKHKRIAVRPGLHLRELVRDLQQLDHIGGRDIGNAKIGELGSRLVVEPGVLGAAAGPPGASGEIDVAFEAHLVALIAALVGPFCGIPGVTSSPPGEARSRGSSRSGPRRGGSRRGLRARQGDPT